MPGYRDTYIRAACGNIVGQTFRQRRLSMIKSVRTRENEREPRYRYIQIIDFVHERATTGASKIPVALLIVVNCLLYTASFQMRFCRSFSPEWRIKVIAIHRVTVPRHRPLLSHVSFGSNVFTQYPEFTSSALFSVCAYFRRFHARVRSFSFSFPSVPPCVFLFFFHPLSRPSRFPSRAILFYSLLQARLVVLRSPELLFCLCDSVLASFLSLFTTSLARSTTCR